mmetsp:Transcript_9038/g.18243  ORF Transcript_9038/g.18243 Transcript_9038/m.18243 type:complete len:403 (-) Transcript_9038:115-1323(-)
MPFSTLLFAACAATAAAHSALTIPEPRNAVDSEEWPWGGAVPTPLPFEPWCPIPSKKAVGVDARNITGANGQACFWFSNGCAIGCDECDGTTRGPVPHFNCTEDSCTPTPGPIEFGPKAPICGPKAPFPRARGTSMNATICDPALRTVNTAARCGADDDYFFYSPWRAPGFAPVIDSCGVAGGRTQGPGGFGASYVNTTHAKIGDLGSIMLGARDTGVVWEAGTEVEVAWTIQANHGGGYSYRLCPLGSILDETCFNKKPLQMVGQSWLRWGGEGGRTLAFDPVSVTTGTKAGVMWRKNPVPRAWKTRDGRWGAGSNHLQTGWGFAPMCEDEGMDRAATTQSCTGEWGPYNLEIVDTVRVPADLPAGRWVLNWRMDQEESNQIWANCADITVVGSSAVDRSV